MEGSPNEGELSATLPGVSFCLAVATPEHDSAIRQLLRENPMQGSIDLSFEREPSFFKGMGIACEKEYVVLAFSSSRLVCLGRCVVRRQWLGGAVRRVGYLSELRLDKSARGRFEILRRGYAYFEKLQRGDPADIYFTSIASDNHRARQLLERGIRGLPIYSYLSDFVTLLLPVPKLKLQKRRTAIPWESTTLSSLREVVDFLNARGAECEFATAWSESALLSLEAHGLALNDIRIVRDRGEIVACVALWDQRSFRQTVIRGYSRSLRVARPLLNLSAGILGRGRLPSVGSVLRYAALSPFAISKRFESRVNDVVESLFPDAAGKGIEYLAVGFDASDPKAALIGRNFKTRIYCSRLYRVAWFGKAAVAGWSGVRLVEPELALL
jgi:hypothetical protein